MKNQQEPPASSGMRAPGGVLGRVVAIAGGIVVLVVAFMFSLIALAVLIVGGLLIFVYLKWKTRHLRRHLNQQMAQQANRQPQETSGAVIEGEVLTAEYEPRPAVSDPPGKRLPHRDDEPPDRPGST
jgi:UPF0716 family protein affecting phage T7 exclusion